MEKHFSNTEHQLFNMKCDSDQEKLTKIIPLPKLYADEKVDYSNSNEQFSLYDDICLESDECGYDSDCSLGSLDSLFLRLNTKPKNVNNFTIKVNKKKLECNMNNSSKIDTTSLCNTVTKNQISKNKLYDKTNGKPITTLNPKSFYGKQEPFKRHLKSRFKKNIANGKIFQNKHLKKHIFHSNRSVVKETYQNSEKYSSSVIDKNWLDFKTAYIKNDENFEFKQNYNFEYDDIDHQLSKSENNFLDDFTDPDDFVSSQEVEDILMRLFDESNSFFQIK